MNIQDLINDIPHALARQAHLGTSHVPEKRADMERTEFASTLAADYDQLAALADTDLKQTILASAFAQYREGYKSRFLACLRSRGRCLSPMITGPSRFPVGRNQKRNATADRHQQDLIGFRRRTLDALRKTFNPEGRPIMAGDDDAVARLQAKVAEAEELQALMREVNEAIRRHAKDGEAAQVRAIRALHPKIEEDEAREWLLPDSFGRVGFPAYKLTNNNANIRRIKMRIELLSRDKATAPTMQRGDNGVLYEDCPADNRIRLFFSQIPAVEVRARLKSSGFRWTPSLKCWQAYRNPPSLQRAKEFVSLAPPAGIPAAESADPSSPLVPATSTPNVPTQDQS
jgi:hypothetical protein